MRQFQYWIQVKVASWLIPEQTNDVIFQQDRASLHYEDVGINLLPQHFSSLAHT